MNGQSRYAASVDPFETPQRADPLGQALLPLQMSGAFYCRSELSDPWGLTLPPLPGLAWFHVVTDGTAELEVGGSRRLLGRGDFALVPRGAGHVLRGAPGATAPDILALDREQVSDRYEVLRHGGGGERAAMICGAVRFGHPAAKDLVELLPPVIHVESAASAELAAMGATLSLIAAETRQPRPGGEAMITRLSDILIIQAIRSWIETDPGAQAGWLGALRDEQVGRALALIHAEPAREWTVAALADAVAMSRSAFAARFTELVGVPAMRYVTRWRMQVALAELEADGTTVAAVAARLGYGSEAAFSRAFKRVTGLSPGAAARDRRAATAVLAGP